MSIKSILRAVGSFLSGRMGDAAANRMEALAADLERDRIGRRAVARLKGRSDWLHANPVGCAACNWTGYADYAAVPCEVCDGRGKTRALPIDPAPAVAPWDTHSPDHTPMWTLKPHEGAKLYLKNPGPDKWPVDDDPYAKPEPCDVVQDPGLSTIRDYAERTNENTRRLVERGLSGRPMDSVKSVMDLLQLIERQEMAERELIHRGMEWDPVTRRWIDPDTQP